METYDEKVYTVWFQNSMDIVFYPCAHYIVEKTLRGLPPNFCKTC